MVLEVRERGGAHDLDVGAHDAYVHDWESLCGASDCVLRYCQWYRRQIASMRVGHGHVQKAGRSQSECCVSMTMIGEANIFI